MPHKGAGFSAAVTKPAQTRLRLAGVDSRKPRTAALSHARGLVGTSRRFIRGRPGASRHLPIIVAADAPHHLIIPAFRTGERGFRIAPVLKVRIAVEPIEQRNQPLGAMRLKCRNTPLPGEG